MLAQTMISCELEKQTFLIAICWKTVMLSILIFEGQPNPCITGILTPSGRVQLDPKKTHLKFQEINQSSASQLWLHVEITWASAWSSGVLKSPQKVLTCSQDVGSHTADTCDSHPMTRARGCLLSCSVGWTCIGTFPTLLSVCERLVLV